MVFRVVYGARRLRFDDLADIKTLSLLGYMRLVPDRIALESLQ